MKHDGIVKIKKLTVFDFDDTLVRSEAVVHIKKGGIIKSINAKHWNTYVPEPGDEFDFSDMEKLRMATKNDKIWKIFLDRLWSHGWDHVHVLSARSCGKPLQKYFKEEQVRVQVNWLKIPPGHDNGLYKGRWIEEKIQTHEYEAVEFFDDREDSCHGVAALKHKYPHIHFKVWRIIEGELHYVT